VDLAFWIALFSNVVMAGEVLRFKVNPPPQACEPFFTEDGAGIAETESEALDIKGAPTNQAVPPTDHPTAVSVEPETAAPLMEPKTSPLVERRFVRVEMGNIRQGPGRTEAALFLVKLGDRVAVRESRGAWHLIETVVGVAGRGHKSLSTAGMPASEPSP
jgi:hypothetical protein